MPSPQGATAARPTCPGPHPTPEPGDPLWCHHHVAAVDAALRDLPDLADQLRALPDGTLPVARGLTSRGTLVADTPSPSLEAVDDLRSWVREEVDRVAAMLDLPGWRVTTWNPGITNGCWFLAEHAARMLAGPVARSWGLGVLARVEMTRRLAGADVRRMRVPVPCPACDLLALTRAEGSRVIECGQCGLALCLIPAGPDVAGVPVGAA